MKYVNKKIDLHCHTLKTMSSEKEGRNVEKKEFLQKITDGGVGVVAITNHHTFDKKQFDDFSKNDEQILILPGAEMDVFVEKGEKKKRVDRQLNVIVDPQQAEKFEKLVKSIGKQRKEIHDFFKCFKHLNPLYYLDFKNGKQKFQVQEYEELKETSSAAMLLDSSNLKTSMILYAKNFDCLVGSDAPTWEEYPERAKKLLTTRWNFTDFRNLRLLFVQDNQPVIKRLINNIPKKEFEVTIGTQKSEDKTHLEIFEGVNVIFGSKGTGKTEILSKLCLEIETGNKVHYESAYDRSSSSCSCFEDNRKKKDQREKTRENDSVKERKEEIKEAIEFIKEYKHPSPKSLLGWKHHYEDEQIKSYLLKDVAPVGVHYNSFDSEKKLLNALNKASEIILENNEKGVNKFQKYGKNIHSLQKAITDVISEFREEYKEKNTNFYKERFTTRLVKALLEIVNAHKGTQQPEQVIGLFQGWEKIQKLQRHVKTLKRSGQISKRERSNLYMPEKGHISLHDEWEQIDVLETKTVEKKFRDRWDTCLNNKNIVNWRSKVLPLLQSENLLVEKEIESLLSNFRDFCNTQDAFENYFIISKSRFYLKTESCNKIIENYKLSTGENAYWDLNAVLEEDVDFYLLDEPSAFLGNVIAEGILTDKITNLSDRRKKIVIVSHNPNMGLRVFPINMLYRQYSNDGNWKTFIGSPTLSYFEADDGTKIKFLDVVPPHFEGSMKSFEIRREIYESKKKNNDD